jgi:hypothetical protein
MGWTDSLGSVLFGQSLNPNRSKLEDRRYIMDQYRAGIAGAQGREAPQAQAVNVGNASAIDTARGDQFRGREVALEAGTRVAFIFFMEPATAAFRVAGIWSQQWRAIFVCFHRGLEIAICFMHGKYVIFMRIPPCL